MDWKTRLSRLEWNDLLWPALVFLVTFGISLGAVVLVIVWLPPRFFLDSEERQFWIDRRPAIRWLGLAGKNLLGIALVLAGLGLSLPGIPGQGLLTILIGLILLDFPGKRRLERKLLGQPRVLRTVNKIRQRFHRPPFVLEESDEGAKA